LAIFLLGAVCVLAQQQYVISELYLDAGCTKFDDARAVPHFGPSACIERGLGFGYTDCLGGHVVEYLCGQDRTCRTCTSNTRAGCVAFGDRSIKMACGALPSFSNSLVQKTVPTMALCSNVTETRIRALDVCYREGRAYSKRVLSANNRQVDHITCTDDACTVACRPLGPPTPLGCVNIGREWEQNDVTPKFA